MPEMKGAGSLSSAKYSIDTDSVLLRVLGRDRSTGAWAAYDVVLEFRSFDRLHQSLCEDREDQAQERIPY